VSASISYLYQDSYGQMSLEQHEIAKYNMQHVSSLQGSIVRTFVTNLVLCFVFVGGALLLN